VGTAYYVSPEMLRENKASPASDLWALGCIIFRMLTGAYPFKGETDFATFNLILECKYRFPEPMIISDADT
jgi:3-phosphoinositide dependent protein kinase-1